MKNFLLAVLLFISQISFAQNTDLRIEITYNLYATGFDNHEYLDQTIQVPIKNTKKVNQLIAELNSYKNTDDIFRQTEIDTLRILNNPKSLIKLYKNKGISWNQHQVDFISKKLQNLNTYKSNFSEFLKKDCCIDIHQRYRNEYTIKIYNKNQLINIFTSRKSIQNSLKIPWKNNKDEENYNFKIDQILFEVIGNPEFFNKLPNRKQLTSYLVSKTIDYHIQTLYELSAKDYSEELNELKSDFEIISTGEVFGYGRYSNNLTKTYFARLSNNSMLPQINIMFLATKEGNSIYTRDSIKSDYKEIINRVQNIEFLKNYIKQTPSVKLDIYYFNNKPINDYNIDGFNKNPIEWKKYDKHLENISWDKKNNIVLSPNNVEDLKISEKIYCGCNYRFEKSFAEKAIFIGLKNKETKENSIWYLLPDNTVLLYLMEGEQVLNYRYTEFGTSKGLQYPCVLFDLNGKIINNQNP